MYIYILHGTHTHIHIYIPGYIAVFVWHDMIGDDGMSWDDPADPMTWLLWRCDIQGEMVCRMAITIMNHP